jgi:protocatechuate 3,4-dioxygenase beta subunit
MRGIKKLFGQIGQRGRFGLTALLILASQLIVATPVFAADFTLSGQVTGGNTSQPIENATVDVLDQSTSAVVGTDNTDAGGNYAITVTEGTYNVRVTPPVGSGYQASTINDVDITADKNLNIILITQPDILSYSGTLRDENGTPVDLGIIRLSNTSGAYFGDTDAAGHFTVNAPAGQYKLLIRHGGAFLFTSEGAVNLTSDMTGQDLILPLVKLTVNVVDQDGNPIPGIQSASFAQNSITNPVQIGPGLFATTNSNANGSASNTTGSSVTFDVIPNNTISSLQITPLSSQFKVLNLTNLAGIGGDAAITVQVERLPFSYSGTLRDQDGAPITSTSVRLIDTNGITVSMGNTDTNGNFAVYASAGQYKLFIRRLSSPGFFLSTPSGALNLTSDMTGQDLTVTRVKLTVNVVDQNGDPVNGIQSAGLNQDNITNPVQLRPGISTTGSGSASATNATGNSLVFDVFPNNAISSLSINPTSSEFKDTTFTNLAGVSGDTTITVQVERLPFSYSGTLRDENGAPVNLATVRLSNTSGAYFGDTDAAGHFTVNAPAGQYKLHIKRSGVFLFTADNAINLTSNMSGQDLTWPLVKLTVNVVDPDGNPINGIQSAEYSQDSISSPVQLGPGLFAVTGNAHVNASNPTGSSVVFDVIPNNVISSLKVTPSSPQLKAVTLTNLAGMSGDGTLLIQLQRALPPGVPEDLTGASPTNTAVVLSWNVVAGATSYKLFRDGVEVGSSTTSNFTDNSLTVNGTYNYTVAACNEAGCSNQSAPVSIVYDTMAPALGTPVWTANPVAVGTNTTVSIGVTDSLSGVAGGEYFIGSDPGEGNGTSMNWNGANLSATFGSSLPLGTYSIGIRAKDTAGNWSGITTTQLVVRDVIPPIVSYLLSSQPNVNGWYKANVTIDWQSTDPTPSSGTPTDPPNTVASTEGANITYTSAPSCDPAGNCATGLVQLSIDKTIPTVGTPVAPQVKRLNQTASVTATAADALSGVWNGEFYLDTDPGQGNGTPMSWNGSILSGTIGTDIEPGVHTIFVRSRDKAGNWSAVTSRMIIVLPV